MANNIFLNANYGWAFYVSDTKLLDQKLQRCRAMAAATGRVVRQRRVLPKDPPDRR